MDADFDLSRLDEIPDVVSPEERTASAGPPRTAPRVAAAGPSRSSVRRQRAAALAVSLGWLVWQVIALGLRTDLHKLGLGYSLAQIALPAALSPIVLGVALWPAKDSLGAAVGPLRGAVLASLLGMTAVTLFFPLPSAYVQPTPGFGFLQWILICADIVAIMGVVPLALAAVVLRRSFVAAPADKSMAVGAACGLAAVSAMHLHCENIEPAHVTLAHMVPAMALAAVGALLLRHLTRV